MNLHYGGVSMKLNPCPSLRKTIRPNRSIIGKTPLSRCFRSPTLPSNQFHERRKLFLSDPRRALTPGQVLALYDGERLIGGGTYCLSSLGRADQSIE